MTELERFNAEFHRLGAVKTAPDGSQYIDADKVPEGMLGTYRGLVSALYATGQLK